MYNETTSLRNVYILRSYAYIARCLETDHLKIDSKYKQTKKSVYSGNPFIQTPWDLDVFITVNFPDL